MVIRGIFTNTKLGPERMNSETTVPYIVANECPGLKRGDLVQFVGYDTKFQVVWTYIRSREQENYETVTISEINGKQINITGKNNMEQFRNMNVEINKTIPYLIDVKYVEEKVDDIIKMLMFTKDEVRHIKAKIDYKTKENMDNSLKDLKSWIVKIWLRQ